MSAEKTGGQREFVLFIYDSWMSDQKDAARLEGARLVGEATTEATYDLVDLGPEVALVPEGATEVRGEVFTMSATVLASLDIEKGHPLKYKRARIRLKDGREAWAYTIDPNQARGRRRIRPGDYRTMHTPSTPTRSGPWAAWAKRRR